MNRMSFEAELMIDVGYAVSSIARLIAENDMLDQSDDAPFLTSHTLGGLTTALKLIGHRLADVGEKAKEGAK